MDPAQIESIVNRKEHTNIKQLQCFLLLENYYRPFIKDFSRIAEPLNELLRKNKVRLCERSCQESFESLKIYI